MLIDTHSHLDLEEDILGLLEKCKQNLVTEIISISTDLESSKKNIEISCANALETNKRTITVSFFNIGYCFFSNGI